MKTLRQLGMILLIALAVFFWPITLGLMYLASYALTYGGFESDE